MLSGCKQTERRSRLKRRLAAKVATTFQRINFMTNLLLITGNINERLYEN